MKQVLAKHNKKVMAASMPKEDKRTCDCPKATREAGTCPLQGHCLERNVVYQATVTEIKPNGERVVENYAGWLSIVSLSTNQNLPCCILNGVFCGSNIDILWQSRK